MPKRKRVQREHTEDWPTIQQYTLWPEQTAYELLRPIVLFGDPAVQRAQETGKARSTLERKADAFDEQGMVSFFASRPRKQPQETARNLPPDMRQLIVDLRVEMPTMSLREIAEICEARFDRKPSHNSVKMVLASGPPPSIQGRRFPLFNETADPAQRRHNMIPCWWQNVASSARSNSDTSREVSRDTRMSTPEARRALISSMSQSPPRGGHRRGC